MEELFKRIGRKIDVIQLSKKICMDYQLGNYHKYELIVVGIDDLSYYLYTSKGKYVVKMINHEKTMQEINEFIQKNLIISKHCKKVPKIILCGQNLLSTYFIEEIPIHLVVMECINGRDLYSINQEITKEDIQKLAKIIISFHQIQEKISVTQYDEYSFMSIKEDYEKTKLFLPEKIKPQVEEAIKEFNKIEFRKLPSCFIHGDCISTNIMKDNDEELWLIDFFQSGNGIRILDIVKILNSVIDHYQYTEHTEELEQYFLEQYSKQMPLTEYEVEVLPILRKIDAYAGIILETYDVVKGENSLENEFWLKNDQYVLQRLNK